MTTDISFSLPSKVGLSEDSSSSVALSIPTSFMEEGPLSPVIGSSLYSSTSEDSESQSSLEDQELLEVHGKSIPHGGNPAPECTSINEPALEHSTSGSSSEEQDSTSFLQQSDIMYSKNLVFDNIDKTINPSEMRSNTQAKSLHYVHIYATKNRIDFSSYSQVPRSLNIDNNLYSILPTSEDYTTLKQNLAILVARTIHENILFLERLSGANLSKYSSQIF